MTRAAIFHIACRVALYSITTGSGSIVATYAIVATSVTTYAVAVIHCATTIVIAGIAVAIHCAVS